jgi:DNA-binding NarL/FixJ family response regulator
MDGVYQNNRYDRHDIAIQYCFSGKEDPFIWSSVPKIILNKKQRKVIEDAKLCGVEHGIALPINHSSGAMAIASATFDVEDRLLDSFINPKLEAVTQYFHALHDLMVTRNTAHFNHHQHPLSQREQDVLNWLSKGCTYSDISDKLNIGISTVRKHVQAILKKLKSRNTSQAVAIGVHWNIIK